MRCMLLHPQHPGKIELILKRDWPAEAEGGLEAFRQRDLMARLVPALDNLLGVHPKIVTGRRQFSAAAAAAEQDTAQLLLQRPDAATDRRLHHTQSLRGDAEAASLANVEEATDRVEIHR